VAAVVSVLAQVIDGIGGIGGIDTSNGALMAGGPLCNIDFIVANVSLGVANRLTSGLTSSTAISSTSRQMRHRFQMPWLYLPLSLRLSIPRYPLAKAGEREAHNPTFRRLGSFG